MQSAPQAEAPAELYAANGPQADCIAPVPRSDLAYNGEGQELVTEGTATGGTMKYSLDQSVWSTDLPKAVNAGTYTVYYKAEGDSTHSDSDIGSVEVKIGKMVICWNEIKHISKPKLSVSNAVYNNGFENLKYKITDSTVAAYPTSSDKNGFTEFKNGARFDFDVMSYDKDGNARLIVIKDVNEPMMGVILSDRSANYWIVQGTDGLRYEHVFSAQTESVSTENNISVVQFDYNYIDDWSKNGIILNGTDFENAVYNPTESTFNSEPADEMTFMSITNEKGSPECEIIMPDKNMLYSGTVYTSSYGQKIVRITKSVSKSGLPTVKFDAYESKDDSSKFHLTADYSKNGFDGNGTIFLAVYRGTALDCVFTYKLQDGEQSGSEICQDVYYKPGTDWKNYSVVGYVWYDDMKPIYPSCPIDIDYR